MLDREAAIAEVISRIDLVDLLRLGPGDVLRLVMLLALRRGDLDAAASYARQLQPLYQPHMSNPDSSNRHQAPVLTVNRLVRELHDPELEPGARLVPPAPIDALAALPGSPVSERAVLLAPAAAHP